MGNHVVLHVDRLLDPTPRVDPAENQPTLAVGSLIDDVKSGDNPLENNDNEEKPLIQKVECRICQEEDNIKNLETPCVCNGSLKYAHRACVQRWCNEKGDITCEICHEPYKHGYAAPPRVNPDETTIDISGDWNITGMPMDLRDPRILAMAAAQRHLLEAEYDEYAATNTSGAAFCRFAALILMALLLLRHAVSVITSDGDDDDASTIFSLFLLYVAGFLLPCYIMAWAISILQRRRQRQEATALVATEVAFILQSGQGRGLQFTIAPESPSTPHQEPHL